MIRSSSGVNQARCMDCKQYVKEDEKRCEPCWQRELRIQIRRKKATLQRRAKWLTS